MKRRRTHRRGITILEIMVGLMVLALTVIAASAMFPLSALLRDRSGGYSRAAALTQRKLEQVRRISTEQLNYDGLLAAQVIDSDGATFGGATEEYHFSAVDTLGTELKDGHGHIRLTNIGGDLVNVEVEVTWTGLRGRQEAVSATTAVSSKTVWREP